MCFRRLSEAPAGFMSNTTQPRILRSWLRHLDRQWRWPLSFALGGCSWAWLAYSQGSEELPAAAGLLLIAAAWLLVRRLQVEFEPASWLLLAASGLIYPFTFLASSSGAIGWLLPAFLVQLLLSGLILDQAVKWWCDESDLRWRRRIGRWLVALLTITGLLFGNSNFLIPLALLAGWRWLSVASLHRWIPLAWLLFVVQGFWAILNFVRNFGSQVQASTFDTAPVDAARQLEAWFAPSHGPALAFTSILLLLLSFLLVRRLLMESRIRTKLATNALLTGLLPLLLLGILIGTAAFVVLGTYRAHLVSRGLDTRMESGRLITSLFAQAYSNPLDRQAQQLFEQQIRSLGSEHDAGRGHYSLYLRQREADPADSTSTESWRRLISSWRMPGDFPLDQLELPADWRTRSSTGVIRVGSKAWQVAMVERERLLALGFFPLDAEAVDRIAEAVGSEVRLVSISGADLPAFLTSTFGFGTYSARELGRTRGYPVPSDPFSRRFFALGLSRIGDRDFPLADASEQILAQAEALPGKILPVLLNSERVVIVHYVVVLVVLLLNLIPLLLIGFWIAWRINLRITRSTEELRAGTEELARGNLDLVLPIRTEDELGRLARSFNAMSSRIRDNMRDLAVKERLERELTIARNIQQGLLPAAPPCIPGLQIAGGCRMALETGGDYYDFVSQSNDSVFLALGDVSGKGVAAALLMSNLQAAWRSMLELDLDSAESNVRLNDRLAATTADELFVTFVQGQLERTTEGFRLHYSNAGHNPPLLLRAGTCRTLDCGGMALGMFAGVGYDAEDLELVPGDWLIFYTDGLTEAQNGQEEEFGEDRLRQLLEGSQASTAEELEAEIHEEVRAWEKGNEQVDDLTLVVIHVSKNGLKS